MHRLAAAALLFLLAGCLSHPAPPVVAAPVQVAAAPLRTLDWRAMDCQAMTWSVPVLASDLRPYLPEGFEPAPVDGPAATGVDQAAMLGFRSVECASGLGQKTVLRSVQTGSLFTSVLPPVDLRDERFSGHYSFGWDVLVASEAWRAKAAAWDLPVHDGGAENGPAAEGFSGQFAMDTVGTFSVTGRMMQESGRGGTEQTRTITRGAEGFALWDASLENLTATTGLGLWSVTPDSWVAKLLGATQGAATFTLSTWDQPDAWVHWPAGTFGPVQGQGGGVDGGGLLPPMPPAPPVTVK